MDDKFINFLCVRAKNLKSSIAKYEQALISPELKGDEYNYIDRQLTISKARFEECEFMLSILSESI